MGSSSESPEVWRAALRGVDCGTGGGSFMARNESKPPESPKPKPSAAAPPDSPVSPHGEAAAGERVVGHFCDRQLIRNVAMHCQNIRIKCLMWYGSGVHVNIPFHICFTSVLEILLFRKGERETTLTSHRGGKWIDVKLI